MTKPWLTPQELAARWQLSVLTLANWRSLGRGPRARKFGRSVRYSVSVVERYEKRTPVAG